MTQKPNRNHTRLSYWLSVIPLFSLSFLVFGEHLIVVPLSAAISAATGLPVVRSGLLVAIYPIAAAFSAFVSAPFSDRLGRKKMLLILCLGFSLATYGFALSSSITTIIALRIVTGFFGGPIFATILAFVGDSYRGRERTKIVTLVMLTFSIASILAVPVGSWLGDAFTWRVPFFAISAAAFLCFVFILFLKPVPTGAEKGRIWHQYIELLTLLRLSKVRKIFMLQFFMIIGLFGFFPHISVWLSTNYGFDSTRIGLCYMQGGIGGIAGNTIAGLILKRGYRGRLITFGSLIMCLFFIAATQEILPGDWVGVFFAGLMFGGSMRMPAFQLLLTELIPIYLRGRLMALSMIVSHMTMGLGGIWSLPLLEIVDGRLEGISTIGIIGCTSLFFIPYLMHVLNKEIAASKERY